MASKSPVSQRVVIPTYRGVFVLDAEVEKGEDFAYLEECLMREVCEFASERVDDLLRGRWLRERGWEQMPGERPWQQWDAYRQSKYDKVTGLYRL